MLADMAIGIETSRLAVQRSAWEVDQVSGLLECSNVVLTRWKLVLLHVCFWLVPWGTTAELEGIWS